MAKAAQIAADYKLTSPSSSFLNIKKKNEKKKII